ncbi:hypothetical protein [Variovorax boronicumulans]|nr:hypothetical protein [Variovorax boronicumulans]
MTLIALPPAFRPESFSMTLAVTQRAFSSPFGGSEQVIDQLNDRWTANVVLPRGSQADVAAREAFVGAMRGMANTCLLWHMARSQPIGTMRGAPTAQAAAAGAGSLTVNTVAGATLRMGDMIGVSGLLLQVAADATANGAGVIVVPLVNRLRRAITAGTAVTWNKPSVEFRLVSVPSFQFFFGYGEGASLDFVEAVS